MNWIIEHIGWLVALSLLLAFGWSRRTREHRGVHPESRPTVAPRTIEDEAQAERTRRIREEIRRKIAERQGQPDSSGADMARGPATIPTGSSGMPPIDPFGGPTRRGSWRFRDALKRLRGK